MELHQTGGEYSHNPFARTSLFLNFEKLLNFCTKAADKRAASEKWV